MSAGAPVPAVFNVDVLAESFNCLPSEVREEDEVDLELRILRLKVRAQVERDKDYFAHAQRG